jgi:Ni/Co efflux regulator RcnB
MRGPTPNNAARGGPDNGRAPNNAMRGPAPNNNAMRGPDNGRAPNNAMRGPAPNNNAMRGPDNRNGAPGNRGGRQDFSSYHRNFSAPQHYHAPSSYRRPRGWYARRWTFGEILPSLFWAQDYWLNDYNDFGLMSPPPGTVWVRDGEDALLIDRDSGEIIQVEYSVFY